MSLTLTIINTANTEPQQQSSFTFDQGGSIGRAASNDWVLQDKSRFISGKHATIQLVNGVYQLTDTSTNGVFINNSDAPIGKGGVVALKDGDRLLIGEFEVSVSLGNMDVQAPAYHSSPDTVFGKEPIGASPPLGIKNDGPVDPLALFDAPNAAPQTSGPSPFGGNLQTNGGPAFPPQNTGSGSSNVDHASPLNQPFSPPNVIPDDWDFGFSGNSSPPLSPSQSAPPMQPVASPPQPPMLNNPEPYTPPPPPPPPAKSQAAVSPATLQENTKAFHALLNGLGLSDANVPVTDIPKFMHIVGQMLREAVSGSMSALRARTNIKSGFRMSMTTIKPAENNPLKFSIGVEEALANMFSRRSASYLPPVEAMRQGFRDIENHQLATMAGMQAAIHALLRNFDPNKLQNLFDHGSGGILSNKKAKYWDAYVEHFQKMSRGIQDDFQNLCGDEFARAYEDQIRRLEAGKQR